MKIFRRCSLCIMCFLMLGTLAFTAVKEKKTPTTLFQKLHARITSYPIPKNLITAMGTSDSEYRQAYVLLSSVSGISPESFEFIVKAYVVNGREFCNQNKDQMITPDGREVTQLASLVDMFFYMLRRPSTDDSLKSFLNCFFLYNEIPVVNVLAWKTIHPSNKHIDQLFISYRAYLRNVDQLSINYRTYPKK